MSHIRPRTRWMAAALSIAGAAALVPAGAALAAVGTPAAAGQYTSTVQLNIGDEANGRACSAVLVDASWVLTATSCFAKTPGATVVAGKPALKTTARIGTTTLDVVSIVPRGDRDVVLAKLSKPVTGTVPVKLAAAQPAANAAVTAAGFGRTKTAWVQSKVHTAAFGVTSSDATTLALTGKGTDSICQGDAGGPLVNSKGELTGINNRSWQGGCLGTPATETRTGAIAARTDGLQNWMQQEILAQTPGWKTGAVVQTGVSVYQGIRLSDGSWTTFTDIQSTTAGSIGGIKNWAVTASGVGSDTHVIAVGGDGHLQHTVRSIDGTWTKFGDINEVAGTLANVTKVSTVSIGNDLHVLAVSDGKVFHTIRNATGNWTKFGDISAVAGAIGTVSDIATASVAGQLQVMAVSSGKAKHTIRDAAGQWTVWGDVAQAAGATGPISSVSMAGVGNDTHIVIATDSGAKQHHTMRKSTGSWDPFTELVGVLGQITTRSVSVTHVDGELQVAVVTTGNQILHTIRHADRTWAPTTPVTHTGIKGNPGNITITGTL
ncbi:S1 family peptidase [Streptomyces sp. NBC_01244]|uniref:S1 family peptidase n=1 Tax=Streptomyces sp. NBC_01244 TaxID=2903797 RepID=UPI002E113AAC|nr:S1 family peptidase [Streptomyces sp. NBC_01244]